MTVDRDMECMDPKQELDSAQWNSFRVFLHGSGCGEEPAAGPEAPAAAAGSPMDKPKKKECWPVRGCPGHTDAVPTAHIQLASEYPQEGDEVELLFTTKPRKWVKGKVLSTDFEHNKSFKARIEIEDSDEFHAQINAGCVHLLSKHASVTGSSVFW